MCDERQKAVKEASVLWSNAATTVIENLGRLYDFGHHKQLKNEDANRSLKNYKMCNFYKAHICNCCITYNMQLINL